MGSSRGGVERESKKAIAVVKMFLSVVSLEGIRRKLEIFTYSSGSVDIRMTLRLEEAKSKLP